MNLLPRHLLPLGLEALDAFPTVVVQGARQTGKSTFARMLVNDRIHHHFSLDDETTRTSALADSHAFVRQFPNDTLVIDEIQRCPELLLAVKSAVDEDRRPGRFLLTGSSDLLRLSRTPDSLAGRAVTLHLQGFSQGELSGQPDDFAAWLRELPASPHAFITSWARSDYIEALARGGYPELGTLTPRMRTLWIDGYIDRLLNRDIADVSRGLSADRLSAVLRLIAANQSGELVQARIANELGMPKSSVRSYLSALDTLYLTTDLRPWSANLTRREVGRHKVSVTDSALALRLNRTAPARLADLSETPLLGVYLESFAATELTKQQTWTSQEFDLYHFRDRNGLEVDLVMEFADNSVFLLEVKATQTYRKEHFSAIRSLAERLGDRFLGGAVLGLDARSHQIADRMWAFPLSVLWEASAPNAVAATAS
ncbi:MAG: ATP-binding protein [Aeromicrobium sp.]|uniref:ATP-binding protein n=1 Tax=Aeromicrobium sp. TaxID=1871063 RepID=UPI0039E596EF